MMQNVCSLEGRENKADALYNKCTFPRVKIETWGSEEGEVQKKGNIYQMYFFNSP